MGWLRHGGRSSDMVGGANAWWEWSCVAFIPHCYFPTSFLKPGSTLFLSITLPPGLHTGVLPDSSSLGKHMSLVSFAQELLGKL